MKKLILSTILILISWTVSSQTGTIIKEDTKCFPISVTKRIAQDLLRGDSAINELKLTNLQLLETEKKVSFKDSIIVTFKDKEKNYINIIDLEREKFKTLEDFNDNLQLELKKQKIKGKITSIGSFSFGIILLGLLFIK
jgi:hypothetical protein